MKTSTQTASLSGKVGAEKAIEFIAKAGFDAWDFSLFSMCGYDWGKNCIIETDHPLAGKDYLAFSRKLRKIGEDNGIYCNQSHAPFPTYCKEIEGYFKRAIECTAEAGGRICVIHPDHYRTTQENAQMYLELLPFAKDCGVKIATENMWGWEKGEPHCFASACGTPESFCAHLDAVNDDFLVACLDIGHAEMVGSETTAVELINALGSRLRALHIHDNDKLHDSHQIPFSMSIDFDAIVKALKKIDYKGEFTLEADSYLSAYTEENAFEGIKNLADSARKLANMFETL